MKNRRLQRFDLPVQMVEMKRRALIEKQCKHPHLAGISGNWTEPDLRRARQFECKVFEKPFAILKLIE